MKTGNVQFAEYSRPDVVASYAPVAAAMAAEFGGADATAPAVARLAAQVQQFQRDHLGEGAIAPPVTRIPARMFRDAGEGGAASVILKTCLAFKRRCGWSEWRFQDAQRVDDHKQMLVEVEAALRQSGHLSYPRVFFAASVAPALVPVLSEIVSQHGGIVVDERKQATHVVDYFPEYDDAPAEDSEYCRTLAIRSDKSALVHWWYYPNSYDEWVPSNTVSGTVDEPPRAKVPRRVCVRWVRDVARFNEWGYDDDYDLDAEEADADGEGAADADGAAAVPAVRVHFKMGDEKLRAMELDAATAHLLATTAKSLRGLRVARAEPEQVEKRATATRSDQVAEFQPKTADFLPEKAEALAGRGVVGVVEPDEAADADDGLLAEAAALSSRAYHVPIVPPRRKRPLLVPSCARWFNMGRVHALERRSLPEFFSGEAPSKTPEVYLQYRNFIVNTYRMAPSVYLTPTACRRSLAGDACAILRVHAFLESWGLINFEVDPDSRPAPPGPPTTADYPVEVLAPPAGGGVGVRFGRTGAAAAPRGPGVVDVGSSGPAAQAAAPWSDDETLKLLEAIEAQDSAAPKAELAGSGSGGGHSGAAAAAAGAGGGADADIDWGRVAAHVGSRSAADCEVYFLQLRVVPGLGTGNEPVVDSSGSGGKQDASLAAQARAVGSEEDARIRSLMAELVELQARRVARKLDHFAELEAALEVERQQLEAERAEVLREKLELVELRRQVSGATKRKR